MALALVLTSLPGVSLAQSGCTAMWATIGTGPSYLGWYNKSPVLATPKFTTLSVALSTAQANALAVDPADGTPYYYDRTGTAQVRTFNLNTMRTATVGTITPASPDTNANILGAFFDGSGNLIMMSNNNGTPAVVHLANISKVGNTTAARWQTLTYAGGTLPQFLGGSGDIFISSGQVYLMSNSTPTAAYPVAITIVNGSITSAIAGNSTTYVTAPTNPISVGGGATDAVTGISYFGGNTAGQSLYSFDPATSGSHNLVDSSGQIITDLGACTQQPAPPTISKTFNPTYRPLGGATTTVSVFIVNSNPQPIWLDSIFTERLPTGMTVATPNQLNTGACAPSGTTVTNVITATAGQATMTFAAGGRVPTGGCTITFSATGGAQAADYVNTIPVGSLSTTAGDNATAATATFHVGTDFTMGKQVRAETSGPLLGTTTSGTGQTMQYVLTITNSSTGGTGSVTFTDTLPTFITPVYSITAVQVGGGSCTTVSAVVTGRTRITGTVSNGTAGSTCTVTVTAMGTSTGVIVNTATLAPIATTSDYDATDNSATATVTITPIANITISKTNGLGGTVVAGATVVYTITVANLGPSAATPSYLLDPGGVPGLSCAAVTCTPGVGATCPVAGSTTMAYLQGNAGAGLGIQINTFSNAHTLTFAVTCGVTATGLP